MPKSSLWRYVAVLGLALCACARPRHGSPPESAAPAAASAISAPRAAESLPTKLPPLPAMTHVVAVPNDDSASITFDPVDGAVDYRVYPLPSDPDIAVAPDGHVVIHDAIYRCAGDRESPSPQIDSGPQVASNYVRTEVDRREVGGTMRTIDGATLGYVYTDPAEGRIPVYALGDSDPTADNGCFFARWAESRAKKYTTSETERAALLKARYRDDGVAFYVPRAAGAGTRRVYTATSTFGHGARYYFADGPEAAAHPSKEPAFVVLAKPAAGTAPLMRVFYNAGCGISHDELVAGKARFERAYKQGDKQPWWSLLWTGITEPTTLVVEALDAGCPFQGHLSPASVPKTDKHQAFVTLDEVRATSPSTEVFLNGQHAPASSPASLPKAIARSFVKVAPKPHPTMDWFEDFSPKAAPEAFTRVPCGEVGGNCFKTVRMQSKTVDAMFIYVDDGEWAMGQVLGELWVTYADWGSDVNGKFRLTPKQKATLSPDSFLHATMEVDASTTGRRYPQILISDQEAPVQYGLVNGNTVIVQTFGDWPNLYQVEVCNHRTWDVNNQCPVYDLYHLVDAAKKVVNLAPNDEVGEHASADHRVAFDAYASTKRIYLFLDGQPYGCADLPAVGVPSGPVTVTFGDVLYHSGIDNTFAFHRDHMQIETRRHFDNLGFSSGVPAPPWDESRLPCIPPIAL